MVLWLRRDGTCALFRWGKGKETQHMKRSTSAKVLTVVAALGLMAVVLGACASPQEIAAADDTTCQSFGAKPGTDVYVQCRMQQQAHRDAQQAQRDAARRDVGERLRRAGDAAQSLDRNSTSTTTTCDTMRTGPSTSTIDCRTR